MAGPPPPPSKKARQKQRRPSPAAHNTASAPSGRTNTARQRPREQSPPPPSQPPVQLPPSIAADPASRLRLEDVLADIESFYASDAFHDVLSVDSLADTRVLPPLDSATRAAPLATSDSASASLASSPASSGSSRELSLADVGKDVNSLLDGFDAVAGSADTAPAANERGLNRAAQSTTAGESHSPVTSTSASSPQKRADVVTEASLSEMMKIINGGLTHRLAGLQEQVKASGQKITWEGVPPAAAACDPADSRPLLEVLADIKVRAGAVEVVSVLLIVCVWGKGGWGGLLVGLVVAIGDAD